MARHKDEEERIKRLARSPEIQQQVEEKLASLHQLPTQEELVETLDHVTVRHKKVPPRKKTWDELEDIPPTLRSMPEGPEKQKAIAAAAKAELALGGDPHLVAARYGIPVPLAVTWHNTLVTVGAIGRRDRLGDMIWAFIEQEFKSLIAISMVTSDDNWVKRQDASELAQYIAVKSDRLLMLLQAFGRVESSRKEYVDQLEVIQNDPNG